MQCTLRVTEGLLNGFLCLCRTALRIFSIILPLDEHFHEYTAIESPSSLRCYMIVALLKWFVSEWVQYLLNIREIVAHYVFFYFFLFAISVYVSIWYIVLLSFLYATCFSKWRLSNGFLYISSSMISKIFPVWLMIEVVWCSACVLEFPSWLLEVRYTFWFFYDWASVPRSIT